MMLVYWIVGSVSCFSVLAVDYIVNYDRLELAYYDKSLVKDSYFLFRKYNRTNYCLNVSFNLLQDLDGNDMVFTSTWFFMLSNTYKPVYSAFKFNVCEYWRKNIFGTTEHLSHYGNLEGCDIKKGFYYLYNYMPDVDQFPKYVPFGHYMVQVKVEWNSGTALLTFEWYITSELKLRQKKNKG